MAGNIWPGRRPPTRPSNLARAEFAEFTAVGLVLAGRLWSISRVQFIQIRFGFQYPLLRLGSLVKISAFQFRRRRQWKWFENLLGRPQGED